MYIYIGINIGNNGCNQAYGPSYGVSSSVVSQRYSPMLSMCSLSPPSILDGSVSPIKFIKDEKSNDSNSNSNSNKIKYVVIHFI